MRNRRFLLSLSLTVSAVCWFPRAAFAESNELPSFQEAAKKLQDSIVTVRVSLFPAKSTSPDASSAEVPIDDHEQHTDQQQPPPGGVARGRVTVCSGVSLGDGLVIAPVFAASDSVIRITLPGGEQASARLRVIDEYSGLSLLVADHRQISKVELSDESAEVGSWILSAAAWGVEQPVVSLGIVSGHDRSLAGMSYPPLLQCSLPTAETSAGAGVVDSDGNLLGVIVAVESEKAKRGWVYAVPVRHVKRLLRAHQESAEKTDVVVLRRRRPVVGMILSGNPDEVVVKRVEIGSPAEKAGIRAGNRILESDGIKIRSVYQAVRPILNRQPGDSIVFRVEQENGVHDIEVVLGGGIVLPSAPFEQLGQVIRPKLHIDGLKDGRVGIRNAAGSVKEVFAPSIPSQEGSREPSAEVDSEAKIKLLEKALDGYQNVIVFQQTRLKESELRHLETERTIRRLEQDIRVLKEQLRRNQDAE